MPIFTRRVQIRFAPEQVKRLQSVAQSHGVSLSALIREAVEAVYLRDQERLEAVRLMAAMSLPVADWEEMERQSTDV